MDHLDGFYSWLDSKLKGVASSVVDQVGRYVDSGGDSTEAGLRTGLREPIRTVRRNLKEEGFRREDAQDILFASTDPRYRPAVEFVLKEAYNGNRH